MIVEGHDEVLLHEVGHTLSLVVAQLRPTAVDPIEFGRQVERPEVDLRLQVVE